MRIVQLSLAGVLVQGVCLALFAFVSQTRAATVGKPIVYGVAIVGIIFVIWRAVTEGGSWVSLCLLPILLGIGYIAAWELVGAVLFRGLLWEPPTLDDMWLHLDIACLLAGVYGIATATAFAVHGFMRQRK